jgi:hypothetical protein
VSITKSLVAFVLLSCIFMLAGCDAFGSSPTLLPAATATGTGGVSTPNALSTPIATDLAATTAAPLPSDVPPATVPPTAMPPTAPPPTAVPPTSAPSATKVPPTATVPPTAMPPTAIPPQDASRSDPLLMLASYFDAISRKDYHAAAAYLVREGDATPDAAAANKVAQNYPAVTVVLPVVNPLYGIDPAAGSQFAAISTLLVMTKSGGGQRYMAGCMVAQRANPFNFDPARDSGWHVYMETLHDVAAADAGLLAQGCDNARPPVTTNDRSNPVRLLASLYDAINRLDYPRAYGYWEQPPSGMSEPQFANGYASTASVLVGVRPPVRYDGAAGSQYAPLPSILIATHSDSSKYVFVGCYVARRTNPGISGSDTGWRIYSGSLAAAPGNAANAALLATTACP